MMKQINTILVPIDFSENTDVAISKALEFCQEGSEHLTVHLFHVQQIAVNAFLYLYARPLMGYAQQHTDTDMAISTQRLDQLKHAIEKQRHDIKVTCWVSFGEPVQESIIKKAKHLSTDLIVIGKSSHHTLLTFLNTIVPSKLAAATGIPVLTAKPGSLHQEIRTVVIPVGNHFPGTKLDMLSALRGRSRPHIRLVIFPDEEMTAIDSKHLLLYTFRAFKSRFSNPINYEVLEGGNKARALLRYCNKVGADVLIVYPGPETQVGNWNNTHISDLLPAESRTQILAVTPG